MKIFYDSEFVERGPQLPIQPVSFGFVREDGAELYVINEECLSNVMKHPWLAVNVRPSLPIREDGAYIYEWDRSHPEYPYVMALDAIVQRIYRFLTEVPNIELWAYYGAYDHVVLCQLFGAMGELPAGIPMFTHDVQWLAEQKPEIKLPADPTDIYHHAMWDARWTRDAYELLQQEPIRTTGFVEGYILDELPSHLEFPTYQEEST